MLVHDTKSNESRFNNTRFMHKLSYSSTDITSSSKNKAVKIMIKTQILLWKTIDGNRRLRVKVMVRVRFLLFYSELSPTDPWCNMLQNLLGRKKYEEAMSGEHPHYATIFALYRDDS